MPVSTPPFDMMTGEELVDHVRTAPGLFSPLEWALADRLEDAMLGYDTLIPEEEQ